jgi:RNA polymerase sigma-70 factor (ECF subfamily)
VGGGGGGGVRRLSPAEFAREFEGASRALWCIAAAITGDRSRAEDVVQEAALAALQKLDDFEAGTSFLAWMGRFVRYTALNDARRNRTRAAAPIDAVDVAQPRGSTGPESDRAVAISGEFSARSGAFDDQVLRALHQLDETARACLLLRTVHDMPYRQISLLLDVPEGTAMSHVHRARQAMRQRLVSEGRSA